MVGSLNEFVTSVPLELNLSGLLCLPTERVAMPTAYSIDPESE
ncbi:MAG: hypothetical protein NVSMB14_08710 [Isosphaeraceae bacterium]